MPGCYGLFLWGLIVPSDAAGRPHDCMCYSVELLGESLLHLLVQTILFLSCPSSAGQVRFDHGMYETASQLTYDSYEFLFLVSLSVSD